MLTVNAIADSTIVAMLTENDLSAWESLYDKYASIMYGAVFQITKDERLAGAIFQESFLELKKNKNILKVKTGLCVFLLKYTHKFTFNYLKTMGLMYEIKNIHHTDPDPLTQLLSSKYITVKQSEPELVLNQQKEARRKLREEFNQLRNQHAQKRLY